MNTNNQGVTDFQAIFEANPDAVFILSPQGHILQANQSAVRRYGYSLEELLQMNIAALAAGHLRGRVADRIQQSLLSADTFEWVHRRKDGSEVPVEISANPIILYGESAICASIHDITAHRHAAQLLREREEQMRFIADHAPVLIAHCDANKVYRFVNLPYAALFGLHPSDIVGKHPREILGEEAYALAAPHMDAALAGQSVSYDLDLPSTPNGMHCVAVSYMPERDQAGGVVGFIAAISDITARKQAEESLRLERSKLNSLLENMQSGVFFFDANGENCWMNPEALRIHGFSSASDMLERFSQYAQEWELSDPTGRVLPLAEWPGSRAFRGERYQNYEVRLRHMKSGRTTDVLYSCAEVRDISGNIERLVFTILDITMRKLAEAALEKSRKLLAETEQIGHVGGWEFYTDDKMLTWTEEVYRIHEMDPGYDLNVGKGIDFYTPESKPIIERAVQRAVEYGEPYNVELEIITAKGNLRSVHAIGKADLKHHRVYGFFQDITERKRNEAAAAERNKLAQQISMIAATAPGALASCKLSPDGSIGFPYASPAWLSMFDVTQAEVSEDAGPLLQRIHPDDVAHFQQTIQQSALSMTDWRDEFRVVCPGQAERWVEGHSTPIREADGSILWHGFVTDITERKDAEIQIRRLNRFYATLSETNQMIVRVSDAGQLFQNICEIAVKFAGFKLAWIAVPGEEFFAVAAAAGDALGYLENIRISVHADQPSGRGPTGRAYHEGTHCVCNDFQHDEVARLWSEKAARFGIHSSATFPLRKAGVVVAVLNVYAEQAGIFHEHELKLLDEMAMDISYALDFLQQQVELRDSLMLLEKSKHELEERVQQRTAQLEVAKNKAEMADKVKSAFLATMSHELRTPLNSIIGFTGVMLQGLAGPLNTEQNKQLSIVKNAGRHLLELVNDVLDISKIEAGELLITFEPVELPGLLRNMIDRLRPLYEEQGLALTLELEAGIGTLISNQRRLEQVVGNLLSNALKFTDSGEVRVSCCRVADSIKVVVRDTGIGIAHDDIGKLFQPFVQLDVGPERVAKGTGLGLAISRRIVEALGGEIGVESILGAGSSFYFTLPLSRIAS